MTHNRDNAIDHFEEDKQNVLPFMLLLVKLNVINQLGCQQGDSILAHAIEDPC
jgi:hypothetical protein